MDDQTQNPKLKTLEDIENESVELVNLISEQADKTETVLKHLIDGIDFYFKSGEQEIDLRISELNTKRIDIEKAVKLKLGSASTQIKSSIDTFKQNCTYKRANYQRALVIPVIVLLFVVFLYEKTISYIPWIGYTVYGFPVVKILTFILALHFIRNIFQNLNNSFDVNTYILEKEINDINLKNPEIKEINISHGRVDSVSPLFKNAKGVLETLVVNVGMSRPFIKQTFDSLVVFAKFKDMVRNFQLTVEYYNLLDNRNFFEQMQKIPPANVQLLDIESHWESAIITEIIQKLVGKNTNVTSDILLLLYKEYNELTTNDVFRQICNSDDETNTLAKILIDSKRLIQPPNSIIYTPQDISSVIRKVGVFDILQINNMLSESLRLFDYVNSYVEFLYKNDINPNFKLDIEFIIQKLEIEKITFEEQVVNLAYLVGNNVFSKIISPEDGELVDGFARASVSIKFHDEISLREYASKYSADKYATAIIKAYYEKAEEIDRQEVISLKELLDDLNLIWNILKTKGDNPDFKFLQSQLKEGKWYGSIASCLKDFIDKKAIEIKEQISNIEKFEMLKDAVAMTFRQVKIETIEKSIDAQVFSAYVIMLDSEKGPLADLVDLLSIRDLTASPEKRWEQKSREQLRSIEKAYKIKPKYDFMRFSKSTRIGVLDKGESFLEFQSGFLQDLKTILSKKDESFGIGLVIQRITPSKYSFGILDGQDISSDVSIKNLDVARYIARLASEHVPFEEQASIMRFEKDINLLEIVDMKSIYELIRGDGDDIDSKQKKVLQSPDLKKCIIIELDDNIGINTFKSLSLGLGRKNINQKDVLPFIERVIEARFLSEPGLKRNARLRARALSKRLLDMLEIINQVYELQQKR